MTTTRTSIRSHHDVSGGASLRLPWVSVFYVAALASFLNLMLAWFLLPESLGKKGAFVQPAEFVPANIGSSIHPVTPAAANAAPAEPMRLDKALIDRPLLLDLLSHLLRSLSPTNYRPYSGQTLFVRATTLSCFGAGSMVLASIVVLRRTEALMEPRHQKGKRCPQCMRLLETGTYRCLAISGHLTRPLNNLSTDIHYISPGVETRFFSELVSGLRVKGFASVVGFRRPYMRLKVSSLLIWDPENVCWHYAPHPFIIRAEDVCSDKDSG
ncbi:hypothetical protein BD309DRAFT_1007727 [Dichomitus squalens]|nr:hypothetical protein BD309DRAFT_1007727 [Dichomitus squalens]